MSYNLYTALCFFSSGLGCGFCFSWEGWGVWGCISSCPDIGIQATPLGNLVWNRTKKKQAGNQKKELNKKEDRTTDGRWDMCRSRQGRYLRAGAVPLGQLRACGLW